MSEPRYPGESWAHSLTRASVEAAAAERQRQAEAERAEAARQRAAALTVRRITPPKPAPTPRAEPPNVRPARRFAWHGGDRPHDFRMTVTDESDPR